jgi:membrane-bound lytic murein transglycosylase F
MQRITYRVKVSAQGAKRRISYLLRPSKRLLHTKSNIVPVVAPIKVARFANPYQLMTMSCWRTL